MALLNKLGNLASAATGKANSAIETGKLNLKINAEEKKIVEFTLNIGELLLDKLDAGETFDDEITALYSAIQASRETIAGLQAELDAKAAEEAEKEAARKAAKEAAKEAAAQEEEAPQEEAPAEEDPVPPVCPECGTPVIEGANFCAQCGTKLPEPVPPESADQAQEEAPASEDIPPEA